MSNPLQLDKALIEKIRHPLVNAVGGMNAAIENLQVNPTLAERLLKLSLEKFQTVLEVLDKEANAK